jgi:regulator of protease activity HflC (stomatin/prohibitin superfamily)
MLCCMAATRTQLYLTEEQRRRIDEVTRAEGTTLAEVVRRALDAYLDQILPEAEEALAATFGADESASYPDRDEWERG